MPSQIETETLALMRGEPPGAAMRKACEDFEKFWNDAISRLPRGHFQNDAIELHAKNIARLAFLEGRGV